MAAGGRRELLELILAYCFLQPCVAQIINCTVTCQADQTVYSVPDVSASDCEYSWSYASDTKDTVLANQKEKIETLVTSNNISTVITPQCFDLIIYDRSCVSEGMLYKAECTIKCNPSRQGNTLPGKYNENYKWIVPAAAAILPLLLLLAAAVMSYRHRDRILEKICSYASVNTEADVELG